MSEIADDNIHLRVPSKFKEQLAEHCEKMSEIKIDYISMSRYIVEAAKEKMQREQVD